MCSPDLCDVLRGLDTESRLRLDAAGIRAQPQDGFADAEMGLLVDDPSSRCLFLRVLHLVLVPSSAKALEELDLAAVARDLSRWTKKTATPQLNRSELVTWLKFAIERYPFRLVIAINESDWRADERNPIEDSFWFKPTGVAADAPKVAASWSTPDPRPWKQDAGTRFLGKRICWVTKDEVAQVLEGASPKVGQCDDPKGLAQNHFPGFELRSDEAGGTVDRWEALSLWLRLKWIEHLLRRVRGLDGLDSLVMDVTVVGGDTSSYYPPTVPPLKGGSGNMTTALSGDNGKSHPLPHMSLSTDSKHVGVCLRLTGKPDTDAASLYSLFCLHRAPSSFCEGIGWKTVTSALFGCALSGALPSFTNFLVLQREPRSVRSLWFLLLLLEESLLRVAIVDERAQAWVSQSNVAAGGSVQQGAFIAWLEGEERFNQPPFPQHKTYATLAASGFELTLSVPDEPQNQTNLVAALFQDNSLDTWPVSTDVLVIHQGILDKATSQLAGKRMIDYVIATKDVCPFLVVTSGRGKPEAVPFGVRFLPFSGLQSCLVAHYFDKTLLLRQIMVTQGEV